MKFEDFIKNGQVRKASKDLQLIKSLVECSNNDLKFLSDLEINHGEPMIVDKINTPH
jgi:hypothetical protein